MCPYTCVQQVCIQILFCAFIAQKREYHCVDELEEGRHVQSAERNPSMTTWNGLLEMALIIGSFVVITVIVSICYCWFYKGQHSPVGRHGRSRETPGTNFTDTEASMSATPRRRPDVIQSGVQPPAAASTAWRPANRSEYHLVPCRIDCKNIAAQSSVVPSAPDFPGNDESIMASGSLQIVSIPQPQSPECQQSLGHPSPSSSLPPPAYSELFPGRK